MGGQSLAPYQTCEQPQNCAEQGIFETSSTQYYPLGSIRRLVDGRVFRYAKAGASDLNAGDTQQSSAPVTNHTNMTTAVAAIAATSVTVTDGGTAFTANQYAEGCLHVNDGTGKGYSYKVKSHPANAGSATCVITLYDPIVVALDATSKCTLTANKYAGTIQVPTTPTARIVGVAPIAVTAAYYYWLQTRGDVAVLTNGTIVIGNNVVQSTSVAGSVMAAGADTGINMGAVSHVNADTKYSLIDLMME